MGNYIHLQPPLVWLVYTHILLAAEVLLFFLEVLTMSGLTTFPLVDGRPVMLAQLLPLVE